MSPDVNKNKGVAETAALIISGTRVAGVYAGAVMLTVFYFLLFNKVHGECADRASTTGATRTSLLTAICGNTDAASTHKWDVF